MIIRDPIKMRVECLGNEACDLLKGIFEGREPISIGDKKFIITTIGKKSGNADPECTAIIDELAIVKNSAWNGEGRPLERSQVEIKLGGGWTNAVVIGYWGGEPVIGYEYESGKYVEVREISELRPIRTAEQIAAEDREMGIQGMCEHGVDAGDNTIYLTASALYDAGYRKQADQ